MALHQSDLQPSRGIDFPITDVHASINTATPRRAPPHAYEASDGPALDRREGCTTMVPRPPICSRASMGLLKKPTSYRMGSSRPPRSCGHVGQRSARARWPRLDPCRDWAYLGTAIVMGEDELTLQDQEGVVHDLGDVPGHGPPGRSHPRAVE